MSEERAFLCAAIAGLAAQDLDLPEREFARRLTVQLEADGSEFTDEQVLGEMDWMRREGGLVYDTSQGGEAIIKSCLQESERSAPAH